MTVLHVTAILVYVKHVHVVLFQKMKDVTAEVPASVKAHVCVDLITKTAPPGAVLFYSALLISVFELKITG